MLLLERLLPLQANILQLGALLEDLTDRKEGGREGGRRMEVREGKREEEMVRRRVLCSVERSVCSNITILDAKQETPPFQLSIIKTLCW